MSDSQPVISAEVFVVPLDDGKHLVYAPLRRSAFVANARFVNVLADAQAGRASFGEHADAVAFLRHLGILDAGPEEPPISVFSGDPEPTAVSLFLTTACNLRCTYCYAAAGDTPVRHMALDVASSGIDFVLANARRKGATGIEVAYHGGGEPSVNWPTMTASLAYAKAKAAECGLGVSAAAATNGVLNDRQIDWMVGELQGVSLSFDGLPGSHDRHRIMIGGQGSSERVMHTLRRFDDAGFAYGIRMTVTHDQIAMLPDSVDFVCRHFRPRRIQVEPAYQLGRWAHAPSAETVEFVEAYRQAQSRAAESGCEISYSAARLDTLTNHFCGISQDSFCLTPDGNVSACYESFSEQGTWAKVFFYGKTNAAAGRFEFDRERLDKLRGQAVQHRPYCQGCFAKWHCAGDCHHRALTVNGGGEFAGSERCHITRELVKDQILKRIADSGGLFWHDDMAAVASLAAGKELLT